MTTYNKPSWILVPLCTPMYQWKLDTASLVALLQHTEPHVDGYVPCLSSWEWHKMDEQLRTETIITIQQHTNKPIYVGIKRDTTQEIIKLLRLAEQLGVTWITTPVLCKDQTDIVSYITHLSGQTTLPIIIYNTETEHINNIADLQTIDKLGNIVAIKDSSMNDAFFQEMIEAQSAWRLSMNVLQWMEHKLATSREGDGFLISLANVQPELCKRYLEKGTKQDREKIEQLFRKYNLWGERYISLKAILMTQWIFQSAEEINPFITP